MQLHCPVKTCVWGKINSQANLEKYIAKSGQFFGQDLSGRACDFNVSMPCDKTLYEYMGWGTHKGLDIPVSTGTEIYAPTNGKVTRISDDPTQGIGVVIWDESQGCEQVLWHLKSHNVKIGDVVKVGDLVGISDNTGWSIGPHLHWQVNLTDEHGKSGQAIDPLPYIVWNMPMTETEVKLIYCLAFYREPDETELSYWTNKPLEQFLKQAITDRGQWLTNIVSV